MAGELDFPNGGHGVVDELLDEYLDRWIEGATPSTEELERRAGPHAGELRERLALVQDLSELSDLLHGDVAPAQRLERVAHYEILGELGEGGLSRVYLAENTRLKQRVALKVLDSRALGAEAGRLWMPEEAQLLARVAHDSVVRVTDVDEAGGVSFMVMEHVQGPSLATLLKALRTERSGDDLESHLTPVAGAAAHYRGIAARCRLVLQLASALDACHRAGVVHRDVKPANVLLDPQHVPKLIDFGLARTDEAEGAALARKGDYGTRAYLAPELAGRGNHDADAASDQYSLGVLFYQLLTLRLPNEPAQEHERWRAVAEPGIRPPRELRREIPPDVERICMHCLERHPRDRYPSLGALAADLEAFLDHRAISLEEPGLARRARLLVRRRPLHAALAGLVTVLIGAGAWQLALASAGRGRLLSELEASLAAGLASERPQRELALFFGDVSRAREGARRYEESLVGGLLFGGTDARIDALWEQGSEVLHARLGEDFAAATRGRSPQANDLDYGKLVAEAGWTLRLEELAAPGGRCGRGLHRLGTVELPQGAELLGYARNRPLYLPSFEPLDPDTPLAHGLYRVRGAGPHGAWELDLVGLPSTPRREFPAPEVAPELFARLVPHGGRAILESASVKATPAALAALEDAVYRVAPIRIAAGPCTWADLERALGEEQYRLVLEVAALYFKAEADLLPDDGPAYVPWWRAHQCVTALGARLPTPAELWSALKCGDIAPVEGCEGEWTSGFHSGRPEARICLRYPTAEQLAADQFPSFDLLDDSSWQAASPTAFRFVVPAE